MNAKTLSVAQRLRSFFRVSPPRLDHSLAAETGPKAKVEDAPFFREYRSPVSADIVNKLAAIDHHRRYAYFRIFKAANSTIIASLHHAATSEQVVDLKELQVVKDNNYSRPNELSPDQVAELKDDYFTFTFVRNPYTRLLSCYLDKIVREAGNKTNSVNRALGKPEGSTISLDEFLTYLESGGLFANAHWAPQWALIPLPIRDLKFIGKVESLAPDLSEVLRILFNAAPPVVSAREHATPAEEAVKDMAPDVRRRIFQLYQRDFETFGYSQEVTY